MLVFPDLAPSIIKILYGWSGIYDRFPLRSLLFPFVISSRLNILKCIRMTIKTKTKSYSKPVPFEMYADFESILESVKSHKGVHSKKYQDRIPYCFSIVILSK